MINVNILTKSFVGYGLRFATALRAPPATWAAGSELPPTANDAEGMGAFQRYDALIQR